VVHISFITLFFVSEFVTQICISFEITAAQS